MTQRWIVSYEIEIPRCEQILDVTKAESEPEIEPDRLVNDLRREPITGIAGFRHALRLLRIQSASKLNAVEAVLDKARLSIDDVTQRTLEYKLDSFERLDRMLASAETRRRCSPCHLIVTLRHSALPFAKRSKSKMSNSETSKLA